MFFGIVFSSFIFWAKPVDAILGFGGRILKVVPCDNGLMLTIGPPRPGLFMLMPGSLTFSWYQVRQGPWALGAYTPGGVCVLFAVPIPVMGTITVMGTSLF